MTAADAIRKAAEALGARWIEPPVLQPAGLYLELLGEDLRARAFLVADDDDALCLRPDMTVPAVRMALAGGDWSKPFTLAYDGLVFRRQTEPAREAEFRQIGVERFAPRAVLEAGEGEMVVAALDACRAAGANPDLRLGDVGVFSALVDACGFADTWTRRLKRAFARPGGLAAALAAADAGRPDQLHPLGQALAAMPEGRAVEVVEELLADSRIALVGGRSVGEIAQRLREKGAAEVAPAPERAALAAVAEAVALEAAPDKAFATLSAIGRKLAQPALLEAAIARAAARWSQIARAEAPTAMFSAGFGRGLAYYDGFVFELEAPASGARTGLGGGGRYDGLLDRVAASDQGGPGRAAAWGAMGFALRPRRLEESAP